MQIDSEETRLGRPAALPTAQDEERAELPLADDGWEAAETETLVVGGVAFEVKFLRTGDRCALRLSATNPEFRLLASCLTSLWPDEAYAVLEAAASGLETETPFCQIAPSPEYETAFIPDVLTITVGRESSNYDRNFLVGLLVEICEAHLVFSKNECDPTFGDLPSEWQELMDVEYLADALGWPDGGLAHNESDLLR